MRLSKAIRDLRFVLKELPILGPDLQKAHIVSQAFFKLMPDKYQEFHIKLLGGSGCATEDSAIQLAVSLGVDEAKLREAMESPEIGDTFRKSLELASRLSVTGTPLQRGRRRGSFWSARRAGASQTNCGRSRRL